MVCCLKLLKGPCLTGLVIKHSELKGYVHIIVIKGKLVCAVLRLYMDVKLTFYNFVHAFSEVNVMLFRTNVQSFP